MLNSIFGLFALLSSLTPLPLPNREQGFSQDVLINVPQVIATPIPQYQFADTNLNENNVANPSVQDNLASQVEDDTDQSKILNNCTKDVCWTFPDSSVKPAPSRVPEPSSFPKTPPIECDLLSCMNWEPNESPDNIDTEAPNTAGPGEALLPDEADYN